MALFVILAGAYYVGNRAMTNRGNYGDVVQIEENPMSLTPVKRKGYEVLTSRMKGTPHSEFVDPPIRYDQRYLPYRVNGTVEEAQQFRQSRALDELHFDDSLHPRQYSIFLPNSLRYSSG